MNRPQWYGHYIVKNHANRRPQRYVFVDVETSQEVIKTTHTYTRHTLKLGVACFVEWKQGREPREVWLDFEDAAVFWSCVQRWQRKKTVLWVVAHNAQFDFTILDLWRLIEDGTYATSRPGKHYTDSRTGQDRLSETWHGITAIDGTPFHVETEGRSGRVNFTDLQNYYPVNLRSIGDSVGIVKGKWDDVRQSDTDLRYYCHTDVEILKRAYLGLTKKWEGEQNGNWQFSAAGLAYSNYRHIYLKDAIAIHSNDFAIKLEWAALYGGECRCWFRGGVSGGLVHYDVNSLYPSVMQDQVYPTALVDVVQKPNRALFRNLIERYAAVAEVDIATGVDHYPVRHGGKIQYPIGKFRTTLAGPELLEALDAGHITHCTSMAIYTYASIFKRYVLEWWNRKKLAKQKGDAATEAFCKLMLNSLPAKFAQRTPSWEIEPRVQVVAPWKVFPWKDPATDVIYPARSVGWVGQVCRHRVATEHSFPAIYAYVTSYARVKMRQLRHHVPPSCLYYQDTDSLIISRECVDAGSISDWQIGDELGQLRIVGEYQNAVFRGPKNYTVDGRHVISGVRLRDYPIGDMRWSGERIERSSHLFRRCPDGTLRAGIVNFDTPGSDTEGGSRSDGFARPLILPADFPPDLLQRITQTPYFQSKSS